MRNEKSFSKMILIFRRRYVGVAQWEEMGEGQIERKGIKRFGVDMAKQYYKTYFALPANAIKLRLHFDAWNEAQNEFGSEKFAPSRRKYQSCTWQVQICAGINTMSTSNNALKYSFNFMALVIRQNQFCSIMSRNPFKKWSEQRHRKRLRERGEYICIHYLETQKDGICRRQHAGRTAALGVNYSKYIDYYVGLEPGQAGGGPVI